MSEEVKDELKQRLARAVLVMQKMQARIDTLERARSEPIAVVGMGCRFPGGADTPEAFWDLLAAGRDAVRREPASRRVGPDGTTRWAGYLDDVSGFDADFFGLSPREAASLDPRQRMLLEVAWEALEHAGQDPERLMNTPTGVFVGLTGDDYARLLPAEPERIDAYFGTGNGHCFPPGRLSYTLGLRGPSLAVDTACSSSLVAVHLACQSLRSGECDVALAGGANLVLDPSVTHTLVKMQALSPNGRCSAFDARANGFVRGEGAGLVVLKRLSDATAQGDTILAVLRGSAVNQDGRSQGLTAPNGLAQQALLRQALLQARVEPSALGYVEAHGTGTPLGDPIEVEALVEVLGQARADGSRCAIGSVKTNLGHLEAAAGIAGLMKAILALQHEAIPRHLNFSRLNPRIRLEDTPFFIPTETVPWARSGTPRVAGVSAFGMSGTNAHIIIEEAPVPPPRPRPAARRSAHLLTLSARSEAALEALARRHATHLATHPAEDVADVCFTTNTARARLPYRLAVVGDSAAALAGHLSAFTPGHAPRERMASGRAAEAPPKVAFLFTGQGAQFAGMGRRLFETSDVFRAALERCAARLAPRMDLLGVLFPKEGALSPIDQTGYSQPALFALEYALAEQWRAWGVVPTAVMGHSVGEFAAACVAGILSLEDALELIAERGRLMQGLPPGGVMATVFASREQVAPLLVREEGRVSIAADNAPGQLTVSGEAEAVARLTAALEAQGVSCRKLNVSHAFHSHLMEPMLDALEARAARLARKPGTIPLVSNVTGRPVAPEELGAPGYWRRHAREAVRFREGMEALRGLGIDVFVEVGPHATLLGLGRASLGDGPGWLSSLRKGKDDLEQMLDVLGHLSVRGLALDWKKVDPEPTRRRVVLPRYPWQRQRHWALSESAPAARAASAEAGELYGVEWRSVPSEAPVPGPAPGTWWVLEDGGGVAERLAARIEAQGGTCVRSRRLPEGAAWADCAGVVVLSGLDARDVTGPEVGAACLELTAALRALDAVPEARARVWAVTRGAWREAPVQAVLWGLGRTLALEHPRHWGGLIDVDAGGDVDGLWAALQAPGGEDQLRLEGGARRVARLVKREPPATQPLAVRADATYLVTGGQGALGLELARELVGRGARHLVLTSRGAFPERAHWDELVSQGDERSARISTVRELEAAGAEVWLVQADVSRREDMVALLERMRGALPPLRGLVHAAAVSEKREGRTLDADALGRVLAPKAEGAWHLHTLTRETPLDFFVLFSSVAAVWGSAGEGAYAAANAFLDALAAHRRAQGLVATSIAWGLWEGEGTGTARDRRWLESVGLGALPRASGRAWWARLVGADVTEGVVALVDWERLRPLLEARSPRPLLSLLPGSEPVPRAPTRGPTAPEALDVLVRETVSRTLGLPAEAGVDDTRGFHELGLDSIMAVELKTGLEAALGLSLPATLAFNYPSVRALTEHLATRLGAQAEEVPATPAPREAVDAEEPIAIVGMACRLPGGVESPEAFWRLLRDGTDAISEIPRDRWAVEDWYDPDPATPGKMAVRQGGFLRDVAGFDPGFFGISPREAESMDPQQRLMLEVAWEALERAGQDTTALRDSATGVFVGVTTTDYARVILQGRPEAVDAWFASGTSLNAVAGRVSYTFGFKGPSMAVDTACSSSLTALHLACQSLRAGESTRALAAGVNVILAPEPMMAASRARMLAPDGRCKTFDASANGFARAEGCGVLVLERLSDARARGSNVLALIRGTAVNQDGPSSGLTVPNGLAQREVIQQALRRGGVAPAEVSYLEAHGTGTSLGDPIEAEAMWSVLKEGRAPGASLWMGSVKTNLGHLESAAGVAGVMKVVLALRHRQLPAHLHLKTPNPHIDWKGMGVTVPVALTDWAPTQGRRLAGVSSFGFSGTNAHVVLEEAPPAPEQPRSEAREHVLRLSARSEEALRVLAGRYARALEAGASLEDLCFTAAVGRARFEHRGAWTARTAEELRARLLEVEAGREWAGARERAQALGEGLPAPTGGHRVEAPTYPFERQRYWWREPAVRPVAAAPAVPHFGRRLRSPALDALVYEAVYGPSGPVHLEDHRLFGTRVAAGSSHVSLVLSVLQDVHGSPVCTLENVAFPQALSLGDDEERTLQVIVAPPERGGAFEVKSWSGARDGSDAWVLHASGTVRVGPPMSPEPWSSREQLLPRCSERHSGEALYQAMRARGYTLGPGYQWIHSVARGGHELVGELRLPALRDSLDDHVLHPGLVDSCFQVLASWTLDLLAKQQDTLLIPFSLERFTVHRRPRGAVWCHARIREGREEENTLVGGDLRLFDEEGLVAEALGFRGRMASREVFHVGAAPRSDDARYEVHWAPAPPRAPGSLLDGGRPWSLWMDAGGVGEHLARQMEAGGATVRRIHSAGELPPESLGVVYLAGLDARIPDNASAEAAQHAVLEASGGVLDLVKALGARGGDTPVWLVTRGARTVAPGAAPALAQAPLWALGRVIDRELPGSRWARVDLEPGDDAGGLGLLLAELAAGVDPTEREVAFRGGTRLHPVLREGPPVADGAMGFAREATYLITGGLGGLGLEVAKWMVERGARHLMLVGRRAPSSAAEEAILELERAGAHVAVESVDVSREEDIVRLLHRIDVDAPPLRGIVHAAGVLDDGALEQQDRERFARVMDPKVAGAWNLHRLTRGLSLDFFVLFSSASATVGSPGQGNYAVANAFLDALVHERRAQGLPAQSLAWGPWAETGMVGAPDGQLARALARRGIRPLPTQRALALLEEALRHGAPHVALMSIQWPVYLEALGALGRSSFYGGRAPAPTRLPAPVRDAPLARRLQEVAPHERARVLARGLQDEAARVLRLEASRVDWRQGFAELGMDSLMAIELRDILQKQLGVSVPATVALDHPTIDFLARHLLAEVLKLDAGEVPAVAPVPTVAPVVAPPGAGDNLDGLSDEELARLVAEDLARDS
ncbi:SDR family NAD(P)-dependent oxidoreductase [Melittangium boletus]|uniref:SDR family NAD(P)-dependent oxidoreductase n=1 Tax=Melittangium boletus TaxID=83453 RepID=UPI003DA61BA9